MVPTAAEEHATLLYRLNSNNSGLCPLLANEKKHTPSLDLLESSHEYASVSHGEPCLLGTQPFSPQSAQWLHKGPPES